MAKTIKLKCTANAHVEGDIIKAGVVDNYDEQLGKRLIASNRFEVTEDPVASEADVSEEPETVADLKAALDELGVQYSSKATKAELEELYDESQD